jgi:hypothetical protein
MSEPDASPKVGAKLTPRYRAILVASALGILVVGSALRPRKPPSETTPPPPQTEVHRLRVLAERQSLETMTRHFAGIAAEVAPHLVRVQPASSTGIAWDVDLVVAAGQAEPAPEAARLVTASEEPLAATRVVGGPELPLTAFQVAGRLEPVARRDSGAPDLVPGQWLVAVWRGNVGPVFAPGHYVETRPVRCGELFAREVATSQALAELMAGAGLFDLDGTLVAVVLPCNGRYAALSPESVTLGLVQGRSLEGQLRALYGLRVVPLDEAARRHLGSESRGRAARGRDRRRRGAVRGVAGGPATAPVAVRGGRVPAHRLARPTKEGDPAARSRVRGGAGPTTQRRPRAEPGPSCRRLPHRPGRPGKPGRRGRHPRRR